jgi:hypothetical protein
MLALADRFGRVHASVPGIAHQSRVPDAAAREALRVLESPDPDSRTSDHDGRRIERIEGGWRLLNYVMYREMKDAEAQRERKAKNKRDQRSRQRMSPKVSPHVTNGHPKITRSHPIAEAEAEAYEETNTNTLVRITSDDVESVYRAYPRKVAKGAALKAIEAALKRLDSPNPVAYLISKAKAFSESEAGNRGRFTPHPATWFNRSSYLDDPKEWEKE